MVSNVWSEISGASLEEDGEEREERKIGLKVRVTNMEEGEEEGKWWRGRLGNSLREGGRGRE